MPTHTVSSLMREIVSLAPETDPAARTFNITFRYFRLRHLITAQSYRLSERIGHGKHRDHGQEALICRC